MFGSVHQQAFQHRDHLSGIYHSYPFPLPFLVGISKTTLDKSLGLTKYKRDFKNKVHTKSSYNKMEENIYILVKFSSYMLRVDDIYAEKGEIRIMFYFR